MAERRITGWSPDPAISHADIVDLLYGMTTNHPDFRADDPDTWKYHDRYLTSAEQYLVRSATRAVWDDVAELLHLERDRNRERIAWQQEQDEAEAAMRALDNGDEAA